ncbi:MAG: ribosome hibernation promoting factor [Wenzhouxiangellaceae bacterium]
MQITISGHHIDITPALHAYVTEKVGRIERHFDNLIGAQVILKLEKNQNMAEAIVSVGGGPDIFANADDSDLYAAIDALSDKLDRQVVKHKEKVTSHHRQASKASVLE